MAASPHEVVMSSMRDACVMIKHEINSMDNGLFSSPNTESIEEQVLATLYQLAYSWTHDEKQASELVDLVMREPGRYNINHCDSGELSLYTRLFQRWILQAEDYFHLNPVQKPASCLLSDSAFLQHCVSCLPKYQRVVLTLVDIANLSYRQASYVVNVDEQKIRSWLTDARMSILQQKHLRACS